MSNILYADAAARWPEIQLPPERFQSIWARLSDTSESPLPEHAADLFLVAACLEHQSAALAQLEALLKGLLPSLASFRLNEHEQTTLVSDTLHLLLAAEPAPKLLRYSARGPLAGWVQALMARRLLDLHRQSRAQVELEEVLLGLSTDGAPEVELIKQRYRGSFSEAFRSAIGRLAVRQRNLLRQYYLDQLALEELGLFYRVHRATVARWLADARAALLELTRDEVCQRLGIGRLEVDSIMRLVSSRLDLSAGIFLQGSAS